MSLLGRIFTMSLLIAGCAIGLTAWLASQATTGSIRQEQGDALATDAALYDELLGYAAKNNSWHDVKSTVDKLAKQTGRRIALTTPDRRPLADSGDASSPQLPVTPKAQVDPLNVNLVLKPGDRGDIDERAVGPFRLTELEHQKLRTVADRLALCDPMYKVVEAPNGHPRAEHGGARFDGDCTFGNSLLVPTDTERAASTELIGLLRGCVDRLPNRVKDDLEWARPESIDWYRTARPQEPEVAACLASARREQLRPYVAPPALLFLTTPTGDEPRPVDLSTAGVTRIALTALGILALAGFASWLTATQLVRPIRALTAATKQMGDGDRTVRVEAGSGELGELASGFNAMSERLAETERQRQALVSDVAHELRTPLGNITGWLEATQDGVARADPALIAMLLEESLLLQRLVDDLRDLAHADAGTLRLHPEPIDLAGVVAQVVAAHQSRDLTLTADTTPTHLTADPVRLRQAIGNLVANAVRYTPSGGTVTVRAFPDGGSAVVEVADTGAGIAAEDLPHVFDRFWRADKSRSRATGGSGLGLAITRHLVEAHGGSVSVSSEPGSGSTFRVTLPNYLSVPRKPKAPKRDGRLPS
ncbi:two-component sensor histidine kinase [Lentzea sp. NBRC 105346]|uniref:HAMP domain-containing sensor histidine kinase n=1 Tax=Lentzea sp. NBRC 105346 TaxID=3032205 RepID=UPI0024A073C3|nr:HAMP domain-containing sensor histidine kinase [Lentzea sp. NBRC 105346]GLZ30995.1 two-component sensor histidine kinase [Lentzea sp. NBRC 105346]